jgi:hypothetical protein
MHPYATGYEVADAEVRSDRDIEAAQTRHDERRHLVIELSPSTLAAMVDADVRNLLLQSLAGAKRALDLIAGNNVERARPILGSLVETLQLSGYLGEAA